MPWLPLLVLGVVVVAAYWPSLGGDFIWDDESYVRSNPDLRSPAGLWRIWASPLSSPQYYPLTFTSFWLEHQLWGGWTMGYHLVNLALHLVNVVLVGLVLTRLGVPGAWLGAAIFALHPVHVESVAWISERKNLLATAFALAAILEWETWSREASARSYAIAFAALLAALLSKTSVCVLPVALLVLAWWRGVLSRRLALASLPLAVVALGLAGLTAWREASGPLRALAAATAPLPERVSGAAYALGFQLRQLVWPTGLTMIYPADALSPASRWLAIGVLVGLLGAALVCAARTARGPLTALALYAVGLAPTLGIVHFDFQRFSFAADHFQYTPSIAPIAFVAACVTRVPVASIRPLVAGALLIPLALLTWRHSPNFRDAATLWRQNLEANPLSWMAHIEVGLAEERQGARESAASHYRRAVDIRPDSALARYNLGRLLLETQHFDEAAEHTRVALEVKPDFASAAYNLGVIELQRDNPVAALQRFEETLRIAPRHANALFNAGLILAQRGDWEGAGHRFEAFLDASPPTAAARQKLAVALGRLGRPTEAAVRLREAVDLEPTNLGAKSALVGQLVGSGDQDEARSLCAQWAQVRPAACETIAPGAGRAGP